MHRRIRATHILACGATDVGLVRPNNEDALSLTDLTAGTYSNDGTLMARDVGPRGVLLAVADGMGGAEAGEIASAMTLDALRQHLSRADQPSGADALRGAVVEASRDVRRAAAGPGLFGMGATLVAAYLEGTMAYVACVGDSRAYALRGNHITRLTKDQSYVEVLIESGVLTRQQAETSPYRNVILQAMGQRDDVRAAITSFTLRNGDLFLLCSDGLTRSVADDAIARVVLESPSITAACHRLVALANARGGLDNVTTVLAEVTGDELPATGSLTESGRLRARSDIDVAA